MSIQATAKVQITIEVSLDQPWGDEATVAEVHKRASDEARTKLTNAFDPARIQGLRIIGEPRVTGILTERKD